MKDTIDEKRKTLIQTIYTNWKTRKIDRQLDEKNYETLNQFLPFEKNQKRKFARVNLQTILNRYDMTFDQYEQYNQQIEVLLNQAGCEVTAVKILSSLFSTERIQLMKQDQKIEYYCYNGVMDSACGLLKVDPRIVSNIQEVVTNAQAQLPEFINGCVLSSTTNRFRIELTTKQVNVGTFLDEMMHHKNFELIHYPHQSPLYISKIGPQCQSYLESQQEPISNLTGVEQLANSIYVFSNQLPTYLKDPEPAKIYQKK